MKNVLFFTHSLSGGGAEKTVRRISKYLNSHEYGIKAYVCVVYDDPVYHGDVDNLIVMEHKSDQNDSRITKGLNVLRQIREMKTIKRKYQIDTCVSFLPGADIINVLSGIGERQIVSVRNKESLFTHNIFKKIYVKTAYMRCDKIVAVTEVVRQDCIDFFGVPQDKVVTIHNAISDMNNDPKLLDLVSQFIDGHKIIVNVGRLTEQKGQDHLLRAFAIVHKAHSEYRLLILGDGERKRDLEELASELGIEEAVMFAGSVINPAAYLKKSDIFVLSSNVEGMPNVLLEAMQCGLPCVSTECGAREILAPDIDAGYETTVIDTSEYGILVPVCRTDKDEKMLAEGILKLITDTELAQIYREKASECVSRFKLESIIQKWIEVL